MIKSPQCRYRSISATLYLYHRVNSQWNHGEQSCASRHLMQKAVVPGRKKQLRGATRGPTGSLLILHQSCCTLQLDALWLFAVFNTVACMFRASLRSVTDPLQHNVCLSCLARRFDAPVRLRQFHAQPARWTGTPDMQVESNPAEVVKPGPRSDPPNEVHIPRFARIMAQLFNWEILTKYGVRTPRKMGNPNRMPRTVMIMRPTRLPSLQNPRLLSRKQGKRRRKRKQPTKM